jgi:hypothetical protein
MTLWTTWQLLTVIDGCFVRQAAGCGLPLNMLNVMTTPLACVLALMPYGQSRPG